MPPKWTILLVFALALSGCSSAYSDKSNSARSGTGTNDFSPVQSLAQAIQRHRTTKEVNAADKAMQEFVSQWRPIGKQPTELECLLGKADERTADYLDYRFDTGDFGWSWVFQLSSDTITNFYRIRIN
jgi:hypothetical protein